MGWLRWGLDTCPNKSRPPQREADIHHSESEDWKIGLNGKPEVGGGNDCSYVIRQCTYFAQPITINQNNRLLKPTYPEQ
jgi:hypothetical protein